MSLSNLLLKKISPLTFRKQIPASLFIRNLATSITTEPTASKNSPESSLFADLTPDIKSTSAVEAKDDSHTEVGTIQYIDPLKDEKLQDYLKQKPYKTVNSLLSPLKRRLYLENVKKNGFFKNNDLIRLPDGDSYTLKLSQNEIQALEPSIYLRSWRIKSSVKKTNIVLRALKDLPLKKAITQLHFLHKKVSRDLVEMLERGLEDAKAMNYDEDKLYLAESWVHTDGKWVKRVDCKGRGRTGVYTFRWVSVRFLLKTEQTQKRLAYERAQRENNKKVTCKLTGEKIRGPVPGFYRW